MREGGYRHVAAALPLEKRPNTHYGGSCVGLRACLNGCGKFRLHQSSIPGPSSSYRVPMVTKLSEPHVL
jgi:hypothetical protein